MGTLRRLTHLRMALHADGTDWTTAPVTLKHVAPEAAELVTDYEPIERPFEAGDGENFSALQGVKIGQLSNLTVPFRGLSAGGAVEGVNAGTLSTNIVAELLESIFGRAPRNGTGAVASSASMVGELTLDSDPGPDLAPGDALLVHCESSQKHVARFIVGKSGANLTLCRPLSDDVGALDTPSEGESACAGRVFQLDAENANHRHVFIDAEDLIGRRQLFGALASGQVRATGGGYLALVLGQLDATDWDAPPKANPAYAPPVQGGHIKVFDCPLWIGDDLYMASNVALDFGLRLERRESDGAPNGFWGHVADGFTPSLTFDLHYGSLTAPKEVGEEMLEQLQGELTQDILVQWGRGPGACVAVRMPDADVRASIVTEGAQKRVRVTAMGTRPAGGAAAGELGALQLAIF